MTKAAALRSCYDTILYLPPSGPRVLPQVPEASALQTVSLPLHLDTWLRPFNPASVRRHLIRVFYPYDGLHSSPA